MRHSLSCMHWVSSCHPCPVCPHRLGDGIPGRAPSNQLRIRSAQHHPAHNHMKIALQGLGGPCNLAAAPCFKAGGAPARPDEGAHTLPPAIQACPRPRHTFVHTRRCNVVGVRYAAASGQPA